jgi:two-component system chemotaxis response regulator CheB
MTGSSSQVHNTPNPIKVLIVDDSPTIGTLLQRLFSSDPSLQVVGIARDGAEAIRMVGRIRPNVITMDVQMPNMDGLEATEYIMAHYPTPILVLTASLARKDVNLSLKMLSAGALEILEKPPADQWDTAGRRLIERLKLLSRIKVITHIKAKSRLSTSPLPYSPPHPKPLNIGEKTTAPLNPQVAEQAAFLHKLAKGKNKYNLVAIASSTGGPPALSRLLGNLSADMSVPLLVVQHIPAGFSNGLAEWLNGETPLQVKNAEDGEEPRPGTVYLPADDRHLVAGADGKLYHSTEPARLGLRPSADVTFESLAKNWPGKVMAVILTGMGRDGTAGMRILHQNGSFNIAQDEASSLIFGMPRSAIEAQVVDKVLSLNDIAPFLRQMFQ